MDSKTREYIKSQIHKARWEILEKHAGGYRELDCKIRTREGMISQVDPFAFHGTLKKYRQGCRCPSCRKSKSAASKIWRDRNRKGLPTIKHGTIDGYNLGCRCATCKGKFNAKRSNTKSM